MAISDSISRAARSRSVIVRGAVIVRGMAGGRLAAPMPGVVFCSGLWKSGGDVTGEPRGGIDGDAARGGLDGEAARGEEVGAAVRGENVGDALRGDDVGVALRGPNVGVVLRGAAVGVVLRALGVSVRGSPGREPLGSPLIVRLPIGCVPF